MLVLDQAGRVDEVGSSNRVENIVHRDPGGVQARGIRGDLEFGNAAALYDDGRDAIQPVEARLQVVGGDLPKLVGRHGIGCQAVANDGKDRKGQAVRFYLGRRRKVCLQTSDDGVHALESQNHVRVPTEEEIHLGGTTAGDGGNLLQAGNAVDCFFNRTGDGDQHLVDGHDPVVHSHHDAGEIGVRKNSHGNAESKISADEGYADGQK